MSGKGDFCVSWRKKRKYGVTVEEIEKKLLGNTYGRRMTSCTDYLAKAVHTGYNEKNID